MHNIYPFKKERTIIIFFIILHLAPKLGIGLELCYFIHTFKLKINKKLCIQASEYNLGFLAGNVFDWGAKEVALLMEEGNLDFE